MKLINQILNHQLFIEKPPVLIDIGASEKINPKWKELRKYSICIAFDADERDFDFSENKTNGFKKLFTFHSLVTDKNSNKSEFYLTKSPYCSSIFTPNQNELNNWAFGDKFIIEKSIKIKSTTINKSLTKLNINYIDWFKTDSQGLDLRIFKSIKKTIQSKILVAEFEPGLINAYNGEDKIESLLTYLSKNNFWISSANLKGSSRIPFKEIGYIAKNSVLSKLIINSLKQNPGWVELTYFNNCKNLTGKREYLLICAFAIIEKEFGFLFTISKLANNLFGDEIFIKINKYAKCKILIGAFSLNLLKSMILKLKNIFNV